MTFPVYKKLIRDPGNRICIDTNTYRKQSGRSGSYSTNYQNSGRELMTPDEVRMLDNREAILFIRGERPVMDEKYDLLKHPNVVYTVDGKGKPYKHGVATHAANTFELEGVYRTKGTKDEQKSEMAGEPAFQVLDEVTVEKMIKDGKWDRKKNVSE